GVVVLCAEGDLPQGHAPLTSVRGYMGSAGVWRLPLPAQTGSRRPSFGVSEDEKNDRNSRLRTEQRRLECERRPPPICTVGVRIGGRGVALRRGPPEPPAGSGDVDAAAAVLAELVPRVRGVRRPRVGRAGVRRVNEKRPTRTHYARGP